MFYSFHKSIWFLVIYLKYFGTIAFYLIINPKQAVINTNKCLNV
jgi:hypothetical protein